MSFQFYFVNLEESKERLRSFLKEASFHPDIQFQRFNALRGNVNNPSKLSPGAHGCALSHFQILENFLQTDSEYAVILEDDIILSCNFSTEVLELPSKLKDEWGIIWLGQTLNCHNWSWRPQPIIHEYNETFLTCSFPLGSFGYLVNRKGAKEILISTQYNFRYYDEEMISACKRAGFPQLILKEPLVYANVWSESTIETSNLTKIHEGHDLNLYRRDFELNLLVKNKKFIKFFNTEHLFIGRPPNDLSNEIILSHFEKFKTNFEKEHLQNLMTYRQSLITDYLPEDHSYFGRGLYFLRFVPITVYVRSDVNFEKVPRLPLVNFVKGPLKIDQEIYVQMTQYHYLSRWTFLETFTNISFVGHRCFDFPIKDYFYQGNKEKKLVYQHYNEHLNLYSRNGKIDISFNFLRHLNDYIDENERVKTMAESLNYKGNTIAFTDNPNPLFTKQLHLVKPSDYPDLLITSVPTRLQGKNNVLHLKVPVDENFSEYNLIINCWRRKDKLPNEYWLPSFMTNVINLEAVDTVRRGNLTVEKTVEVALLKEYENIQNYQIANSKIAKFIIILEKFNAPGYISEDIILAYASGAIPVYIGCKEVLDFFNSNTFIYLQNIENLVGLPAMIDHFDYGSAIKQSIWKTSVPSFILPW